MITTMCRVTSQNFGICMPVFFQSCCLSFRLNGSRSLLAFPTLSLSLSLSLSTSQPHFCECRSYGCVVRSQEFQKHNVKHLVRVCEPTYSSRHLEEAGIVLHVSLRAGSFSTILAPEQIHCIGGNFPRSSSTPLMERIILSRCCYSRGPLTMGRGHQVML